MARWLFVATFGLVALAPNIAGAARTLLADFLARPPAEVTAPAMSPLALEACLRRAQQLDRDGTVIDYEIAAIDREAAEALLLQKQINAEIPTLGNFDESALNEFQHRVIRHQALAKKFQAEFPLYQEKKKDYDDAVREFERNCAGRFRPGDLDTVKKMLGLK